jgi:hypothetical protein
MADEASENPPKSEADISREEPFTQEEIKTLRKLLRVYVDEIENESRDHMETGRRTIAERVLRRLEQEPPPNDGNTR